MTKVTAEEMAEILTHTVFYAGWPKVWAAFGMAKGVYDKEARPWEKVWHSCLVSY